MSMPNIPDINPDIQLKRKEVINLLLSSIALEEISLSHVVNAEAEKLQKLIKEHCLSVQEAIKINDSVDRMMRNVVHNQMLLQYKLMDVIQLIKEQEEEDWDECHDE